MRPRRGSVPPIRVDAHVAQKSVGQNEKALQSDRVQARRALEAARKRDAILAAAARAFARGGYHATTMHDIAREAGYTPPSLYAYFAGKEQIFIELARHLSREFTGVFAAPIPKELTFSERLDLLLQRLFEKADQHRDAVRVFMAARLSGELLIGQELASEAEDGAAFSSVRLLTEWLRANAKPGELGERPLEELGIALAGLAHAFCVAWLTGDADTSVASQTARVTSLFLYGATGVVRRTKPLRPR